MREPKSFELKKWIWSEADFDQMSWHDATIYAIQFGKDISFDIDYIFQWINQDKDDFFAFIVAPVTLVFLAPTNATFNLNTGIWQEVEIEDIQRRTVTAETTEWVIETHQGDIIITAASFRQIVRRQPTLQIGQQLLPEDRSVSSFSTVPDTDFIESVEIRNQIVADFALRSKAVQIRRLRRQLEILLEQRSAGVIEVKAYLLAKRKVEEDLHQLQSELRTTDWQSVI